MNFKLLHVIVTPTNIWGRDTRTPRGATEG